MERKNLGINYNLYHTKSWEKPTHWSDSVNNINSLTALNLNQEAALQGVPRYF